MAFFVKCICHDCNKTFKIIEDYDYPKEKVQCCYCLGTNTQYLKVSKTNKGYYSSKWV